MYNELLGDFDKLRNAKMDLVVTLGNLLCNMELINQEATTSHSGDHWKMPLTIREHWADQEAAVAVPVAGQHREVDVRGFICICEISAETSNPPFDSDDQSR